MSVELRLALQEARAVDIAERVRRLLGPFVGTESALDAGCGTGALAFALAANVAEVVGLDPRADYLEAARASTSLAATASSTTCGARNLPYPSSHA